MTFSIGNLFNTAKPAEPTTPAPAKPETLANAEPSVTPVQTPGTAPNGVVPDNVNTPESPLAQFEKLWETDPNAVASPEYAHEQLDPAKLQEVMGKVDLTKAITPEQLAAINAGGEGATQALLQTMNTVAQQSMMQSAVVTNKMVETAIAKTIASMEAKIPGMLKEQNLSNSLNEKNPIYSNPAVKPVIDAVKAQVAMKYPNATTAEHLKMAQDFVTAMGSSLNPVAPATPDVSAGDDFSQFLPQ